MCFDKILDLQIDVRKPISTSFCNFVIRAPQNDFSATSWESGSGNKLSKNCTTLARHLEEKYSTIMYTSCLN